MRRRDPEQILKIIITDPSEEQLLKLKNDPTKSGVFKQVSKALRFMAADLRHNSLQTHKYDDIENPFDKSKPVFESYAQNKTPCAYRIFWVYGPDQKEVTVLAITPHP